MEVGRLITDGSLLNQQASLLSVNRSITQSLIEASTSSKLDESLKRNLIPSINMTAIRDQVLFEDRTLASGITGEGLDLAEELASFAQLEHLQSNSSESGAGLVIDLVI